MHPIRSWLALATIACLLCACGGGDDAPGRPGAAGKRGEALPSPNAAGGVTGTPDVAPGGTAPTLGRPELINADPQPEPGVDANGLPIDGTAPSDPSLVNPETGLAVTPGDVLPAPPAAPLPASAGPEPTSNDAVAVIRDYYAAINAHAYPRAYALWSGGGRASGQTPEQFAGGFAQTSGVSVTLGWPGAEDAGAGQRYVQVPVSLRATQADGSVKRYAGSFTLHRAVVDGASAEQRAWRIRNADLRELVE